MLIKNRYDVEFLSADIQTAAGRGHRVLKSFHSFYQLVEAAYPFGFNNKSSKNMFISHIFCACAVLCAELKCM